MPFRCSTCNCLQATDQPPANCPNKLDCDLVRVEVVHLLHPQGFGKVLCSKEVKDGDGTKRVPLKLGCDSEADEPTATPVYSAVTCLACLKNFPPQERKPIEE